MASVLGLAICITAVMHICYGTNRVAYRGQRLRTNCCSHYSHTDAELYMRPVPPRLRNATSTPWFSCQPGSPACWCLLDRRPRHLPIQPILADVFCAGKQEIGRAHV